MNFGVKFLLPPAMRKENSEIPLVQWYIDKTKRIVWSNINENLSIFLEQVQDKPEDVYHLWTLKIPALNHPAVSITSAPWLQRGVESSEYNIQSQVS